jgi:hypothetical protein
MMRDAGANVKTMPAEARLALHAFRRNRAASSIPYRRQAEPAEAAMPTAIEFPIP